MAAALRRLTLSRIREMRPLSPLTSFSPLLPVSPGGIVCLESLEMSNMEWHIYIEQNPKIMLGKPVIKGTRLTVELILEKLGDGWPVEDLLRA